MVWTDAVQAVSMLACVFLVMAKGVMEVGGLGVVWDRNVATGRLEPPVCVKSNCSIRVTTSVQSHTFLAFFFFNCQRA